MKVKSESLPGSSVHGIFQARVLEWGAIAFSDKEGQLGVNWELKGVIGICYNCVLVPIQFSSV